MSPEVRVTTPPSVEKDNLQFSAGLDPGQPFIQTQEILVSQIVFLASTAQSVPSEWKGTYLAAIIEISKAALAIDSLDIPKIPQQRERHQLQPSTLPQNPPPPPVPSLPEAPPEPTVVANQTPTAPEPTAEKEATAASDNLATIREIAEEHGVNLQALRIRVGAAKERGEIAMYGTSRNSTYPREELEAIAQQIKKRRESVKIHLEIPLAIPGEPLVSLKEVADDPEHPIELSRLRYCVKGATRDRKIIKIGGQWDARYPESQIRAIAHQLPKISPEPNTAPAEDVKKNPLNLPAQIPSQPES